MALDPNLSFNASLPAGFVQGPGNSIVHDPEAYAALTPKPSAAPVAPAPVAAPTVASAAPAIPAPSAPTLSTTPTRTGGPVASAPPELTLQANAGASYANYDALVNSGAFQTAAPGTLFKQDNGRYFYKSGGTSGGSLIAINDEARLQDLAKQGIVKPGSDVAFSLAAPVVTPSTSVPTSAPAASSPAVLRSNVENTNGSLTANKDFVNAAFVAYTGRNASAAELVRFTGIPVDQVRSSIKSGNLSPGSSLGTSADTSNLGVGALTQAKFSLPEFPTDSGNTDAFMASMVDMFKASSAEVAAANQTQNDLMTTLAADYAKLGQKGAEQANLEASLGVTADIQHLKDVNLLLAQKISDYQAGQVAIQNQPIPQGLLVGQQAALQRQAAVDVGVLQMQAQTLQGNIQLGQQLAQRTIDLEFAPIEAELNATLKFLDLNSNRLTRAESKQANDLQNVLQARKETLDQLKADKQQKYSLMMEVAKAGGDPSVIDLSKSLEENIIAATPALQAISRADAQVVEADGRKKLINMRTGATIADLGASVGDTTWALQFNPVTGAAYLTNKQGVIVDPKTGATIAPGGMNVPTGDTRAQRNNNPLNITLGGATQKWVDAGLATVDPVPATDGGHFLVFNSPKAGMTAAMDLMLNSGVYTNLTVNDALKKWSNSGYDGSIAPSLSGKRVGDLTPDEVMALSSAMAHAEGYTTGANAPGTTDLFPTKDSLQASKDQPLIDTILKNPAAFDTLSPADQARLLPSLQQKGFVYNKPGTAQANIIQQNAKSGLTAIEDLKNMINGNPLLPYLAGLPGSPGAREYAFKLREIVDIVARTRTGATLNPSEVTFYKSQLPQPFDSPETIKSKLAFYKNYFSSVTATDGPTVNGQAAGPSASGANGEIPVRDKATGQTGYILATEFDSGRYEHL